MFGNWWDVPRCSRSLQTCDKEMLHDTREEWLGGTQVGSSSARHTSFSFKNKVNVS